MTLVLVPNMPFTWFSRRKSRTRSKSRFLCRRKKSLARTASRRIGSAPHLFSYVPPPRQERFDPTAFFHESYPQPPTTKEKRRNSFYEVLLPSHKEKLNKEKSNRRASFYEGIYSEKTHFLSDLGPNIPRPLTPRRVHTEPTEFQRRCMKEVPYRGFRHDDLPLPTPPAQLGPKPKRFYGNLGQSQAAGLDMPVRQKPVLDQRAPLVPAKSRARCYSNPVFADDLQVDASRRYSVSPAAEKSRPNSVYIPSPLRSSSSMEPSDTPSSPVSSLRRVPVRRRPVSSGPLHINLTQSEPWDEPTKPLDVAKHRMTETQARYSEEVFNPYMNLNAERKESSSEKHVSAVEGEGNCGSTPAGIETMSEPISNTWVKVTNDNREDVETDASALRSKPSENSVALSSHTPFGSLSTDDLLKELQIGQVPKTPVPLKSRFSHLLVKQDENESTSSFVTALSSPVVFYQAVEYLGDEDVPATFSLDNQRHSFASMTSDSSTVQSDVTYPMQLNTLSSNYEPDDDTLSDTTLTPASNNLVKVRSIPITIVEDLAAANIKKVASFQMQSFGSQTRESKDDRSAQDSSAEYYDLIDNYV